MNKTYCANSPLCDEDSCGCEKWEHEKPEFFYGKSIPKLVRVDENLANIFCKKLALLKQHPNHRVKKV